MGCSFEQCACRVNENGNVEEKYVKENYVE